MIQQTAVPMTAPAETIDYSPLAYALQYVALGWSVLPLHTITDGLCSCGDPGCQKNAGKHPLSSLVPQGLHQATSDPGIVRGWWRTESEANIGIRTGRASGFVAVDVDVRDAKGGEETWAALTARHGTPPPTTEAITGSGGRHLLYAYPPDVERIGNSAEKLGRGIDTRGDGGYIVVEPSRHKSGSVYLWEASSSPLDGVLPAPMPDWMIDALRESKPVIVPGADAPPLPSERVRELRSALTVIPPDERDVWLRVGMALHAEQPGAQGYGLWTEWSQQSEKYDPRDQQRTWRAFRPERGVTAASLFALARECGWVAPEAPVPDSIAPFMAGLTEAPPALVLHRERDREAPSDLLAVPGVLGEVVTYGLQTSIRPVPAFAVQAALALGSVTCARRYVTTTGNYASMYLLNVGRSGVGKEHAKTTIEAVLTAAGQRKLVGGASFSSGGAVYSALLAQPQHIAILDEFGRYMESAAATRDNHRSAALTMLMEAFGRVHSDMSTPRYSSMTAPQRNAKDTEPRIIARPAVSILALTTPATFYGALTSTRVLDGFLNRFVVVEHTGPRLPAEDRIAVPDVPAPVVAWVRAVLAPHGDLDVLTQPDHIGPPRVVGFASDALTRSREMERDMLALADRLESEGLGDMPIRSREIALRLALILALSYDVEAPLITGELMDWAANYVTYYGHQTIEALRSRLADSDTQRQRNMLLEVVRSAGARGITMRELHRVRGVTAVRKADREAALESLITAELVAWTEIPHGPAGGRPRRALVALAETDQNC